MPPRSLDCELLRSGLARLELDLLALVADALAFVRFGFAELTQLGGVLAHLLLVDPLNDDVRSVWAGHGEPLGNQPHELVGIADAHRDGLPLNRCLITDTDDLE